MPFLYLTVLSKISHYDYIIAGAGASGLSLLCYLLEQPNLAHKKILLLDAEKKDKNDKTWCFWQVEKSPFESCIKYIWDKMYFHSPQFSVLLDIAPYRYKMLNSLDFYAYCLGKIVQNLQVTFCQEKVLHIQQDGTVITAQNQYEGDYIFSSIPAEVPRLLNKHYLLQHFKGWFIETQQPIFDQPTLMDFRVAQHGDCRFMYVLPTSSTSALIEYTAFSKQVLTQAEYDAELEKYITQQLGITQYNIVHTEIGVIPMTNAPFESQKSEKVIQIGTLGGYTKPSTGYTFSFIQKKCQKIAQNLAQNLPPLHSFTSQQFSKYYLYDSIFLRVLSEYDYPSYQVFVDMFKKLPADLCLRFLDEETHLLEDLRVMNSVDKITFTKAALYEIKQNIFGNLLKK